jgi:hypothetical protein
MLLPRFTVLMSALVFATCFAQRSNVGAASRPLPPSARPSKLDYLVFASIADSPRWLSLAGYRSAQPPKAAPPAGHKKPVAFD